MAVIGVEPAVKYSFVLIGMQTRRKGQYNAELTLSPRLYVKPLITPITAINRAYSYSLYLSGTSLRGRRRDGGKGEHDRVKRVSVTRDG